MMKNLYLFLLLVGSALGGNPTTMRRCRAACLVHAQEAGLPVVRDPDACAMDEDCDLCWKICEHLVEDPMNWAPVCDGAEEGSGLMCPPGCQSACAFLLSMKADPGLTSDPAPSFEAAYKVIDDSTIHLKWTRPRKTASRKPFPYIFVCYWKQIQMPDWISFATTTSLSVEFTGPLQMYGDIFFKIQAIGTEGIVAEMEAKEEVDDLLDDADDYAYYMDDSTTQPLPYVFESHFIIEVEDDGFLRAEILLGGQQPQEFVVMWMRIQCSVCTPDAEEQQRFALITSTTNEALNASVSLPGLSFNSTYSLVVQDEHYIIYQETFQTTGCAQLESDFQCRDLLYDDYAIIDSDEASSDTTAKYLFLATASSFCVFGVAMVTVLALQHFKLNRLLRKKQLDVRVASRNEPQSTRGVYDRIRELENAFARIKPIEERCVGSLATRLNTSSVALSV
ncbi:hypothetical protein CAPTEDRAFT_215798 [Capitella teleta]|uniref:Fibronectin type-III domain-containing protein n=1 Tax=Capitella teleta TaxID=283909 RepID=R7UKS6_CAPTE|nr:hypothetical protein CAPTEDRAFT_215798 [Capitella teleta]|eukprot:ELU06840.1 hypothetical protein CAPTEDRAFT_215798 [Capitella teleta]